MKYCSKCGWEMQDEEKFCRNCGTESSVTPTATYYDDTPPKTLNKTMQTIIKILLVVAIISVIWNAGECLLNAFAVSAGGLDAARDLFADSPETVDALLELTGDADALIEILKIVFIACGVFALIPLCWVLPMRKKILKAMKEGTTLSAGFKICTLLFVNFLTGLLLLFSKEI